MVALSDMTCKLANEIMKYTNQNLTIKFIIMKTDLFGKVCLFRADIKRIGYLLTSALLKNRFKLCPKLSIAQT